MVMAMLIFGSVGLFVKGIGLPSGVIALVRGVLGSLFLFAAGRIMNQRISWQALKQNRLMLFLSGTAIGFNWIFLFEAYRYTSVSCATLSYYCAPVFVTLLSPWILKEKLTWKKAVSIAGAVLGMILIADIFTGRESGSNDLLGIGLGLIAAMLYASVVLLNKFIKGLSGIETTVAQLVVAAVVLLPYTAVTELIPGMGDGFRITVLGIGLLLVVGIVHTGMGYLLYFSSMKKLPAQTIAVLSYIDPLTAILLSALILGEQLHGLQMVGAGLLLGMTLWSGLQREG